MGRREDKIVEEEEGEEVVVMKTKEAQYHEKSSETYTWDDGFIRIYKQCMIQVSWEKQGIKYNNYKNNMKQTKED